MKTNRVFSLCMALAMLLGSCAFAGEATRSEQTFDLTYAPTEYTVGSIQTMAQLISLWIDQYPLNFEVQDLAPADVDNKVHMDVAMKIALDHIASNYDFTFDDLKACSPQVIFSSIDDAWLVHVVPRNPVETFSITVDSETGVITHTRYGEPTG